MEALKLLVEMVKDLPDMALYVLLGFFAYKVFIVGSIWGVIKLCIVKLHDWATTPKEKLIIENKRTVVERLTISNCFESLITQLERLVGVTTDVGSHYIHSGDVNSLAEAITEKLEREKETK